MMAITNREKYLIFACQKLSYNRIKQEEIVLQKEKYRLDKYVRKYKY